MESVGDRLRLRLPNWTSCSSEGSGWRGYLPDNRRRVPVHATALSVLIKLLRVEILKKREKDLSC